MNNLEIAYFLLTKASNRIKIVCIGTKKFACELQYISRRTEL